MPGNTTGVYASIAVVSVALALWSANGHPQARGPSTEPTIFCVGAGGALVGRNRRCAPRETELRIVVGTSAASASTDAGSAASARSGPAPRDPTVELERRVSRLERSSVFEVVTTNGDPVLTVAPGGIQVYNGARLAVATIPADDEGGAFDVRSASGVLEASLRADGTGVELAVTDSGRERLTLGRRDTPNYVFRVPKGEGLVAGIGESRAATGVLIIGDSEGRTRASMAIAGDKAALGVFNGAGQAVLSLTEGATRGGLLAIGNERGDPIVKMGVNEDRYGVVLTGPRAGFPLVPKSGLPGSYILGCSGGSSCQPE
jgi:hypothetical protein